MSRDGWAALPHGATGLSAVCDCGISWSYSFTIFYDQYAERQIMIMVISLLCHLMYGLSSCVLNNPSRLLVQIHGVRSSDFSICKVMSYSWLLTIYGDTWFSDAMGFRAGSYSLCSELTNPSPWHGNTWRTTSKVTTAFSNIPRDQMHEQLIDWLKNHAGVIENLDDPITVRRE